MTHDNTTIDIISYSITILQIIIVVVLTIRMRRNFKKLIDMQVKYSEFKKKIVLQYEEFTKQTIILVKKEKEDIQQRMNVLSMENAKLCEKNDLLKEKLINLGFSETDLEF